MSPDDRLTRALERRMPQTGLKAWLFDVAQACDKHPDTIRRWCAGETRPDFVDWFNLCRHFGAGFQVEVEGDYTPPGRASLATIIDMHRQMGAYLERLKEAEDSNVTDIRGAK